jgi:hypothetical protein
MESSSSPHLSWVKVVRRIARILSLLLVLLTLFFAIAEAVSEGSHPYGQPAPIVNILVGVLMLAGMILAWRWEFAGGLLSLIGFIGVGIVNPDALTKPMMYIFAVPSVLFLVCWGVSRSHRLQADDVSRND